MALTKVQPEMMQQLTASIMPTGSVIQTVTATTATTVTVSGATYTDSTLTATITPISNTSKILVIVSQPYRVYASSSISYTAGGIQLLRNATVILAPVADSTGPFQITTQTTVAGGNPQIRGIWSCNYLDSPATTSATIYKTQLRRYDGTSAITVQESDSNGTNTAVITLLEIKQ